MLINHTSGSQSALAATHGIDAAELVCPHMEDTTLRHINSFEKGIQASLIPTQDVAMAGNDRHGPACMLDNPADLASVDDSLDDFTKFVLEKWQVNLTNLNPTKCFAA
jgi:hypothetical protein